MNTRASSQPTDASLSGPAHRRLHTTLVAATITASMVLAGCGWFQDLPTFSIINETDETLHIVSTNPDGVELELAVLEADQRYADGIGEGECLDAVVIARTSDGMDFAHQPHQICAEDEWVIIGPD